MSPFEIHRNQIEFAEPRYQLERTRFILAEIEGAEPGDNLTAQKLAEERGLALPSKEDMGFLDRAKRKLFEQTVKAFLGVLGDGSQAAALLGKRQELPIEDRGLLILGAQTFGHFFQYRTQKEEEWATAALMLAAAQEGLGFNNIEERMRKGWGGVSGLFIKLTEEKEEEQKTEAEEEVEKHIGELKATWGDSTRAWAPISREPSSA